MIWTGPVEQQKPQYTDEELERYVKKGAKITSKGCLQSEDGLLIIAENAQWKIQKGLHQSKVFIYALRALTRWLLICLR